jgi:hypothetical protein
MSLIARESFCNATFGDGTYYILLHLKFVTTFVPRVSSILVCIYVCVSSGRCFTLHENREVTA